MTGSQPRNQQEKALVITYAKVQKVVALTSKLNVFISKTNQNLLKAAEYNYNHSMLIHVIAKINCTKLDPAAPLPTGSIPLEGATVGFKDGRVGA